MGRIWLAAYPARWSGQGPLEWHCRLWRHGWRHGCQEMSGTSPLAVIWMRRLSREVLELYSHLRLKPASSKQEFDDRNPTPEVRKAPSSGVRQLRSKPHNSYVCNPAWPCLPTAISGCRTLNKLGIQRHSRLSLLLSYEARASLTLKEQLEQEAPLTRGVGRVCEVRVSRNARAWEELQLDR